MLPQNKYQLQPVEYLLGMSSKLTNLVVLGMLTYLTEGKLHLEDPSGSVPVNLKETVSFRFTSWSNLILIN